MQQKPREGGLQFDRIPGCLAFWDFNRTLCSGGENAFELREICGAWEWVNDGVFGPSALRIHPGGGFRIPRKSLGPLNIHGPGGEVTVCAWIKRESESDWQALAGVWDETRSKRQYALFLNARSRTLKDTGTRVPCRNRIHGHVSDVGTATPGDVCCVTYATGASEVPLGAWQFVAMSHRPGVTRVYVNGKLDFCGESNPFPGPASIFDGGDDGADFTVGINAVRGQWSNPFGGILGGLAVYRRALDETEIARLA